MSRKPLAATAAVLSSALLAAGFAAPAIANENAPSSPVAFSGNSSAQMAAVTELKVSPRPAAVGHTMRVVVRTNPREAGRTVNLRLHMDGKVVTVQEARTNRDGKAELRIPGKYVTKKGHRFTVTTAGAAAVSFRSNADKRLSSVTAPPPAPRGISIEPGDEALYVSWRPVVGATEYRGVLTQGATTTYGEWETDTEHAFTGLTNGAVYTAGAQARNAAGEISAVSTDTNASPTAAAPGPVVGLVAQTDTGQVTLVWDGAARADDYVVRYKVAGTPFTYLLNNSPSSIAAPYTTTIKGLTDGVKYEFQVYGQNDFGRGAGSAVDATPEQNKPTPSPIATLDLTAGNGDITATWTTNTTTGVDNYILYVSPDNQTWTETQTVPSTSKAAKVSGLSNGQPYWVQVVAVVNGKATAPKVAGPVEPVGKPLATPNLRATPSDNSIILNWAPMAGVTKFSIRYRPTTSTTWSPILYVDAPGLNYVIDALDDETGYFVTMSAINGAGTGPAVTLGPILVTDKAAAEVTNANVNSSSSGSATLTWTSPSGVTGFKVEAKRVTAGGTATPPAAIVSSNGGQATYTVSNLTSGATYTFTIYAINEFGYSRGVTVGPIVIQ